jgi:hypothetical protein
VQIEHAWHLRMFLVRCRRLVYASARDWFNDEYPLSNENPQPYGELFVAPIDGSSEPIRLTHNKWEDSIPAWGNK